MLKANNEKIWWTVLSENPSALELLKENPQMVHWEWLSGNPSIFYEGYKYDVLRERMKNTFAEELMMNLFHPKNLDKFASWGFESGFHDSDE